MENDKIINDGTQPEIEKPSSAADTVNKENVPGQDASSEERKNRRKPLLSLLRIVIIIICSILVIIGLFWFIVYGVPVLERIISAPKDRNCQ